MTPLWVSAFLDFPPEAYDDGVAFWCGVTGYEVSTPSGDHGEYASLDPPTGDAHVWMQRLGSGSPRVHLDLHVESPRQAADRAAALGAREVADRGIVVMASPGGFPFCLVGHPSSHVAPAAEWPGGHRSIVDQVCLDIPDEQYDVETAFWQQLTGRERVPSSGHPEFERLVRPGGQTLQLLLQRLDEPTGEVRSHLDLACTDRTAETARHAALGATVVGRHPDWTVMADPAGSAYCITDREPA